MSPQYVDVDLKIGRSSVGEAGVVGFLVGPVVVGPNGAQVGGLVWQPGCLINKGTALRCVSVSLI